MRPKPCRYCEQENVKYQDYEKHIAYCGSKTKKCMECQRNVCLKDWDMHENGGECQAFREENRHRELEETRRKMEEAKRAEIKKEEERKKIEKKQ
jgi:hypothetical protein